MVLLSNLYQLGTGGATKTDEFSEKFPNLYYRFWTFKQGFWSIKFKKKICNMVKGRLELFRKFIRFKGITRPYGKYSNR